jgi:hypothetical protein
MIYATDECHDYHHAYSNFRQLFGSSTQSVLVSSRKYIVSPNHKEPSPFSLKTGLNKK